MLLTQPTLLERSPSRLRRAARRERRRVHAAAVFLVVLKLELGWRASSPTMRWPTTRRPSYSRSYRWFQSLVGPHYDVRRMANYALRDRPIRHEDGLLGLQSPIRYLIPELADLPQSAHPFAAAHARRFDTMMIEPAIYLDAVLRDVRLAGGNIVVRRFESAAELTALPEPTIVNCTGLGARTLFGDRELTAVKGQLTVLLPRPAVDYAVLQGDLYMFSRRDGILLGGTHERDVFTLEPDLAAELRVLVGHAQLCAPLAAARI